MRPELSVYVQRLLGQTRSRAQPVRECVCAAYAEFLMYCLDFSPYSMDFHGVCSMRDAEAFVRGLVGPVRGRRDVHG